MFVQRSVQNSEETAQKDLTYIIAVTHFVGKPEDKYRSQNGDILEDILKQNSCNLKERINLIGALIEEREKLNKKILSGLRRENYRIQELMGSTIKGPYGMPIDPRHGSLEKQLLDIEKEKLNEEINAWKDISLMHKELQYLKSKYIEYTNKQNLLSDNKKC